MCTTRCKNRRKKYFHIEAPDNQVLFYFYKDIYWSNICNCNKLKSTRSLYQTFRANLDTAQPHIDNLVLLCRQGNQRAQFELYNKYYKAMYNTALRIVKDSHWAEDIMQESFNQLMYGIPGITLIHKNKSFLKP